ncbi:MAG TPA: alpha/beta hydrolase-fold protein [Dermatophilaceae bacterium]|nr:alpha/beta hydrolase-fold protein [Dermatophilaceae bacterium]
MALLGWPLVLTLATAAVAVTVATVLLWPRVRGPRPLRLGAQLGMLMAGHVTVLLLVGAVVNDYGYFYGSWSDMLGHGGTTSVVVAGGRGPSTNATRPPAGQGAVREYRFAGHPTPAAARPETIGPEAQLAASWSAPSQWTVRGRLEALQVRGARSELSTPILVYLPPQYFQRAYRHTEFPALEVLTGYPGTTTGLVLRLHYPDVLLHEIAARRAQPMVLVMARPTVAPPRDTECTDVPGGPLALTYLSEDVPSAVEQAVRVSPVGWAAMGDSTGGYCATKMALTHSDVFTSAVSLSGYYHTLKDGTTGDLWAGSAVMRNLNDLEWLLANEPPPPVSLLLTIGTAERGRNGIADTQRFMALVRPPLRARAVYVRGAGHNLSDWASQLPNAIDWVSQQATSA